VFELARYPARATWGSHREEFSLSHWDLQVHEISPALGMLSVQDPVVPSVIHSHGYGPLYGIELSNVVFDPRTDAVIAGERRVWEFGEPRKKPLQTVYMKGLRSPKSLAGAWTPMRNSSFAHWILEDLPSALLSISRLGAKGILVSEASPRWQRRILEEVGLPWMAVDNRVRVERTIFVDRQTDYGWPRSDLAQVVVDYVKDRLLLREAPDQMFYVSNNGSKRADFSSQAFEQRAVEMGYVLVRPERLSWLDQAALFASARKVMSIHGGHLANLIFCKPGTQVSELMSRRYANPFFEILAMQQGLCYDRCWMTT